MSDPASTGFLPTRREGLDRIETFVERMGRRYASRRNYDLGADNHRHVSQLSPWVRHRLVLETELVAAALREHGYESAEKFIQEVCWRTYWKGWLELRPDVWNDYRRSVRAGLATIEADERVAAQWRDATSGTTGIECFDTWARELTETGYLHNHARMWFASIWVFTLKLPWALGADFFLRHLLDGDPASNTLSWRWVAGLQTRGKTYLARASNIDKFTQGRFEAPRRLANIAPPLTETVTYSPQPLADAARPDPSLPSLLLLHEDDLCPESLAIPSDVRLVAGYAHVDDRSPLAVGTAVRRFADGALDDGLDRAGRHFDAPTRKLADDDTTGSVLALVRDHDLRQVVAPWAPVGPAAERLRRISRALADLDVPVVAVRRPWDSDLWPRATKGFFAFKQHIPSILQQHGLTDDQPAARAPRRSRYLRRTGGRGS